MLHEVHFEFHRKVIFESNFCVKFEVQFYSTLPSDFLIFRSDQSTSGKSGFRRIKVKSKYEKHASKVIRDHFANILPKIFCAIDNFVYKQLFLYFSEPEVLFCKCKIEAYFYFDGEKYWLPLRKVIYF